MALGNRPPASPSRNEDLTVLVDADFMTYMCPALVQHKDKPAGKESELVWLDEEAGVKAWVEPLDRLEYLIHRELQELKNTFRTDDIQIHLTPKAGNFRTDIAKTKPYKGQRSAIKPYYHLQARAYLQKELGAILSEGQEADDACSIAHCSMNLEGKNSVIVSQDHDLKCTPGVLYIPRTKQLIWKSENDAACYFFKLMMLGCKGDNVPGIKGAGKAAWSALTKSVQPIWELYEEAIFTAYESRGLASSILEQGQLLHMRRKVDELWDTQYDYSFGAVGTPEWVWKDHLSGIFTGEYSPGTNPACF